MSLKRATGLLMVLVAAVGTAASLQRPSAREHVTRDAFRFDAATLKDTTKWTQVNLRPHAIRSQLDALCRAPMAANYEPERKQNPHAGAWITVYVNNVGRQAMFTKEAPVFPQGSVIVKHKVGHGFDERNKTLLYTIMRKREPGYNPDVGDWEFAVVDPDGATVQASGKLENCQMCHVQKAASDFVFRPYVDFK